MHMRSGCQWDWYQPFTKVDANGGHGGHHLHGPGDRVVIGIPVLSANCFNPFLKKFRIFHRESMK